MYNSNLVVYLCVLLFFTGISSTGTAHAQESLKLCIHPYLPATELLVRFTPLADYLGKKIGQPVEVEIRNGYQNHIDCTGRDEADISYMGPMSYVKMVDVYGKKPLLARLQINGKPEFQGVIVVRDNSSINSLAELTGKRFAFGDPNSTMSHIVPRFMLWEAGVNIDKLASYAFLTSHHNVALGVLIGDYDSGAVKEEVFYKYQKRGLKAIAKTPFISEHLFITRSTLPQKTVKALRNALYHLKDDEEGRGIMSNIKNSMTAMVSVNDGDYDNLRKITQTLKKLEIKP